jgi:hypothetical protein
LVSRIGLASGVDKIAAWAKTDVARKFLLKMVAIPDIARL